MKLAQWSNQPCQACGETRLQEIPAFASLSRVTSDANPWPVGGRLCVCLDCGTAQKVVDEKWLGEIRSIYECYAIYHQAGGAEQPIFAPAGLRPRSTLIAEFIEQHAQLHDGAHVLDFGCGNGAALRTFSTRHPTWRLYGSELSDSTRAQLHRIPNFVELFVGPIESIDVNFDLVTMIHSLEHVLAPVDVLGKLRGLIGEGGRILIEVPNCDATPYDLVIADHLTHFSLEALCLVTERAGFATHFASNAELPKELTWLGASATMKSPAPTADPATGIKRTLAHVAWLQAQTESARAIARGSAHFGIFGTSISATWLAGALGDDVEFFVDEDTARIGRLHLGKPIVAPGAAPIDGDIYIPLIPQTARRVAERLNCDGARFHPPPDIVT